MEQQTSSLASFKIMVGSLLNILQKLSDEDQLEGYNFLIASIRYIGKYSKFNIHKVQVQLSKEFVRSSNYTSELECAATENNCRIVNTCTNNSQFVENFTTNTRIRQLNKNCDIIQVLSALSKFKGTFSVISPSEKSRSPIKINPSKINMTVNLSNLCQNSFIDRISKNMFREFINKSLMKIFILKNYKNGLNRAIRSKPTVVNCNFEFNNGVMEDESNACESNDAEDLFDFGIDLETSKINISSDRCSLIESKNVEAVTHTIKIKARKRNQSFNCFQCTKSYRKRKSLISHYKHHPGFCHDCGGACGTTAQDIVSHNRENHLAEFPFICEQCGESFSRNQQYQVHLSIHARLQKKTYTCSDCNVNFVRVGLYRKHLAESNHRDKLAICEFCGANFYGDIKLKQHLTRVHKKESCLKCSFCDKTFALKPNLDRHIRLHKEIKKSFVCELCGVSYYTNSALKEHHYSMHNKEKDFKCHLCRKQFNTQKYLQQHIISHSEDRPFNCFLCSQSFKLKTHLVRHKQLVHAEFPVKKKLKRFQPNQKGELVSVTEPAEARPKLTNAFQPISNNPYFPIGKQVKFTSTTLPTTCNLQVSNDNMMTFAAQNQAGLHQMQATDYEKTVHVEQTPITNVSIANNKNIFHNLQPDQYQQHVQFQNLNSYDYGTTTDPYYTDRSYNELAAQSNLHIDENTVVNSSQQNKVFSLIEVDSGKYMQIEMPQFNKQGLSDFGLLQYQNLWTKDQPQMEDYASNLNQTSEANTYNNIGNILTNLELLGNNSNFESSNFEIISSNYDQQSAHSKSVETSNIINDGSNNMSYFNNLTDYSVQNIDTNNIVHSFQNHTITDISNKFLTENQRNNFQHVSSFQNNAVMSSAELNGLEQNTNANVILPSLTDYLHYS